MSKSIGGPGCLWLLDEPAVNAKKIRRAVTDTGREVRFDPEAKPGVSNLLTILVRAHRRPGRRARRSGSTVRGYGDLKGAVADAFVAFADAVRERVLGLPRRPGRARRGAGTPGGQGPR